MIVDLSQNKIASKQLVGMLIVLIAKNELAEHIDNVRSAALGTGFMGVMVSLFSVNFLIVKRIHLG